MTKLELLRLAAKAVADTGDLRFANYTVVDEEVGVCLELGARRGAVTHYWNPLRSLSEAMVLSVKLQIDTKHYGDHVVCWYDGGFMGTGSVPYNDKPCEATCLAITMAAAEIGRVGQ